MKWSFDRTQRETVDQLLESREFLLPKEFFFVHHLSVKLDQGCGFKPRERHLADRIISRLDPDRVV